MIFPNFVLNRLISRSITIPARATTALKALQETLSQDSELSIPDINNLVTALLDRKQQLQDTEHETDLELLSYFLEQSRTSRLKSLESLNAELAMLTSDIHEVESQLQKHRESAEEGSSEVPEGSNSATTVQEIVSRKKRKMMSHFSDLQARYFDTKSEARNVSAVRAIGANDEASDGGICQPIAAAPQDESALENFSHSISSLTKFSRLRQCAALKYDSVHGTSNIVSSIEFDRDNEFFACAGVTKKIKIFELKSILDGSGSVHFPVHEITCRAKLSCLAWNTYIKSHLVASDYEGVIGLWDAFAGSEISRFDEHERRIWSVDFSHTDPTKFASGSDDCKVKIWSTNQNRAAMTLSSKANVCCVQFNLTAAHQLAFGSADHHIYYYDLRNPAQPLRVYEGHKKAVSYVKFFLGNEFVSASTDSSLKLWATEGESRECIRTYTGHKNEKNFVGLSVQDDLIACGSETNYVHIFHRHLSDPMISHNFGVHSENDQDDSMTFISSVCWRRKSNMLLVGNSQGLINIMELV